MQAVCKDEEYHPDAWRYPRELFFIVVHSMAKEKTINPMQVFDWAYRHPNIDDFMIWDRIGGVSQHEYFPEIPEDPRIERIMDEICHKPPFGRLPVRFP